MRYFGLWPQGYRQLASGGGRQRIKAAHPKQWFMSHQDSKLALVFVFLGFLVLFYLLWRYAKEKKEAFRDPEAAEHQRDSAEFPVHHPAILISAEQETQRRVYKLSGAGVVNALEKLGYFSFTAPEHLTAVKEAIAEGYESQRFLTSELDEETLIGQCGRYYFCDTEALFEIGGLEEYLLQVKPIFDNLRIPLKWSDEYWSDDITLHTIVLNGKQYDAFRGNPNDYKIWGFALKNFAEMLNDQLALHGSDEKIYLMGGGNDGFFYILTDKQFVFIRAYFTSDEVPRTVAEWWKRGG